MGNSSTCDPWSSAYEDVKRCWGLSVASLSGYTLGDFFQEVHIKIISVFCQSQLTARLARSCIRTNLSDCLCSYYALALNYKLQPLHASLLLTLQVHSHDNHAKPDFS